MRLLPSLALASCLALPTLGTAEPDEHAHHRIVSSDIVVKEAQYEVPDVEMRDEQGRLVRLRELLAEERPVAVNFIFTSCTTVCPVMTASFLQIQKTMQAGHVSAPDFISISIDPSFDTAPVLANYAKRFEANWSFITGSEEDVTRVLRAFDAYRGGKANHTPITLLRAPFGQSWTRVEGLASAENMVRVWKNLAPTG